MLSSFFPKSRVISEHEELLTFFAAVLKASLWLMSGFLAFNLLISSLWAKEEQQSDMRYISELTVVCPHQSEQSNQRSKIKYKALT